jgi:uncharacterized protein (DUF4415 family)
MINPSDIRLDSLPWVPLNATNGFPEQPAVYFAIDSQDRIQYIGRSSNVRGRWKNHHRYEELAAIGGVKVVYLFIEAPELLPEIEAALIEWFDPPLNVFRRAVKQKSKIHRIRRAVKQKSKHRIQKTPGKGRGNPNPSPKTRFVVSPEQLAKKPVSIRLPADIDEPVRGLGAGWIRKVLREALEKLEKESRHDV